MQYEWDENMAPVNGRLNLTSTMSVFLAALEFDWRTALVYEDARSGYEEHRFWALGLIQERVHVLVFTCRESFVRIISLRKANKRETRRYAEQRA